MVKICETCLSLWNIKYRFCPTCGIKLMDITESELRKVLHMNKVKAKEYLKKLRRR